MIHEIEVPLGIETRLLEDGIDEGLREPFFGRYGEARVKLKEVVSRFPCAERLLETTPDEHGEFLCKYAGTERKSHRVATGEVGRISNPSDEKRALDKVAVGCVLAIRDRSAEYLERALQTFAYQTLQPVIRRWSIMGVGRKRGSLPEPLRAVWLAVSSRGADYAGLELERCV